MGFLDTRQLTATHWHALTPKDAVSLLETDPEGLDDEEATARRELYGPNVLPQAPPVGMWRILVRQFASPLVYILAIAAALSLWMGHHSDAGFIAAVLLINALIGGIQEWKAERSTRALQKLLHTTASVARNGEICDIDADQIVPGDIAWLESGDRVPADIRILNAHGLEADESLLTGESVATSKGDDWLGDETTPVADRANMLFAGSSIVLGRAQGVVVGTGLQTQVGQLALDVMSATGGEPPLLVRLKQFTRMIGLFVLAAAVLVAALGIGLHSGGVEEMFFFAVALAVSAIPEGLPVAITAALAIGMSRMARRGVIVRRLGSVEGLGSCTMIATDKTGTLTCNELTVREIRTADGQIFTTTGVGFDPVGDICRDGTPADVADHPQLHDLLRTVTLCNEADLHHKNGEWTWRGDPTDVALLTLAGKAGLTREKSLLIAPRVDEIPFEPERKFAASFNRPAAEDENESAQTLAFVKGAPELILRKCVDARDAKTLERLHEITDDMASRGLRVLAVAHGGLDHTYDPTSLAIPPDTQLLGFVGMIDPLRSGVREAVQICRSAGIHVCMVTGDHPITATAIGRDLDLVDDESLVVTGSEMEAIDEKRLDELLPRVSIFARVTPHQKLTIVASAQRLGNFVAVTGDGVNDAPALRKANIGVAMGRRGTDVAREAADLVISDDNFTTIVGGIEEGRIAYDNIRKVIFLLISTGAAEVIMVVAAVAMGMPLPLLPVQLLWLNLVTNGIQDVALAFEPGEHGVLNRRPRPPRERIFNRLMIERVVVSSLTMGIVGFAAFWYMQHLGWSIDASRNAILLLWVLFENVHIGNSRSETASAFRLSPFKSPLLLVGAVTAFGLHLVAMHTGFGQAILGTMPVTVDQWLILFAIALSVIVTGELHKLVRHKHKV